MSRGVTVLSIVAAALAVGIWWGGHEEIGSDERLFLSNRIPLLDAPPADAHHFVSRFLGKQPVLMRAACDGWDALHLWQNDAYLEKTAGKTLFNVEFSSSRLFGDAVPHWGFELMSLSQFANRYRSNSTHFLYLNGAIPSVLHGDFSLPAYVPCMRDAHPPYQRLINMWWGRGGETSTLHVDLQDNILHMVRGSKRVVLFAPNQTRYLYERLDFARTETRVSPVLNVWRKNAAQFPLYEQAEMHVVHVQQGQALYIPALWWHHVESIAAPQGGNIAVNIWWDHFGYAAQGLDHVYQTGTEQLWEEMQSHKPLCS